MQVQWQPRMDSPFREPGVGGMLDPTYGVEFEGAQFIHAVDFSPDGSTCYCLVDGRTINLWSLGVEWWPEILGGLAGIVVLMWMTWVVRVRRRPQRRGAPHCRRCNYDVTAQAPESVRPARARRMPVAGTLCPECGADLSKRRPRRGRTMLRRLWMPTTVMLAVVLGYGVMRGLRLPRDGWMAKELWSASAWFDARARNGSWAWATKHEQTFTRIMAVETATGAVTGTVFTTGGVPIRAMLVSPNGSHIALRASRGRLLWINARTGRVDAVARRVEGMPSEGSRILVGFDGPDDDPWVYYAAADSIRSISELVRWKPSTGERVTVVEEPTTDWTDSKGAKTAHVRRYAITRSPEGIGSVSGPDWFGGLRGDTLTLRFRNSVTPGAEVDHEVTLTKTGVTKAALVPIATGTRLAILSAVEGVLEFDARTGRPARTGPSFIELTWGSMSADRHGKFLVIPAMPSVILVRDNQDGLIIARLTLPKEYAAPEAVISDDCRWVGAAALSGGGLGPAATPRRSALFLYKLPETAR